MAQLFERYDDDGDDNDDVYIYIAYLLLNTFHTQHQLTIKTVVDLRREVKECLVYGLVVYLFRNAFPVA